LRTPNTSAPRASAARRHGRAPRRSCRARSPPLVSTAILFKPYSCGSADYVSRRLLLGFRQRLDVLQLAHRSGACASRLIDRVRHRLQLQLGAGKDFGELANSAFTPLNSSQTSLARASIASVRNPICRLLMIMLRFIGRQW